MDPTWTSQARHARQRQLSDWGLQVCVELMVYVTSLLLVLICMVAWIRTIFWALFGSGAHRSSRCPEVARAVRDGDGFSAGQRTSLSPPPSPPPPQERKQAITAVNDREQSAFPTIHIESRQGSGQQADVRSPVVKSARLHSIRSQSARAPSADSQSERPVSCGTAYHWTLTANPLSGTAIAWEDKTVTRGVSPAGRRSRNIRAVCPSAPRRQSQMDRGYPEVPAAVHRTGARAAPALPV